MGGSLSIIHSGVCLISLMKKILLSIALALVTTFAFAQNSHLKFMGIELDGSITDFQSKLYAKGFKNSKLPFDKKNGIRIYDGTFMGEDATVVVFYNERSKQVRSAKPVIEKYGKIHIQDLFDEIEDKLDIKYGAENRETELVEDQYLHEFKKTTYTLENGFIILSAFSVGYSDIGDFYLQIEYADKLNNFRKTQDEMDDL